MDLHPRGELSSGESYQVDITLVIESDLDQSNAQVVSASQQYEKLLKACGIEARVEMRTLDEVTLRMFRASMDATEEWYSVSATDPPPSRAR